jgi:hypothetical protein
MRIRDPAVDGINFPIYLRAEDVTSYHIARPAVAELMVCWFILGCSIDSSK